LRTKNRNGKSAGSGKERIEYDDHKSVAGYDKQDRDKHNDQHDIFTSRVGHAISQRVCFEKSSLKKFGEDFCRTHGRPFVEQPLRLPIFLDSASDALALQLTTDIAHIKIFAMPKRLDFPKSRRLTLDSEFKRVRMQGSAVRGEMLTLGFLKNAEPIPTARAGFITSRRVGGAVMRNRVRRRLREIFRKHQHEIRAGVWIVIIASARAARGTSRALEDEWLRLGRRASIFAP
jgi:ribonuclease P protein component